MELGLEKQKIAPKQEIDYGIKDVRLAGSYRQRNDWKEDLNMTKVNKKETEAFTQCVQPLWTTLKIKSTPVKLPGSYYQVFVQVVYIKKKKKKSSHYKKKKNQAMLLQFCNRVKVG